MENESPDAPQEQRASRSRRRPSAPRRGERRLPIRLAEALNPFGEGNARAVAYDLATKAFTGAVPFDQIWDTHPGLVALSQRDRALAIHLAAGVLRFARRLDARARYLTDGKSDDLIEPVQWILRFGLFQVIDCDRIPPHAAVSTAVDAVKVVSHKGIAGLVNAVLRRASREKEDLAAPEVPDDTGSGMAEYLSMPDWLARLLIERYGADAAEQLEHWANHPPDYYIRLAADGGGLDRLQEIVAAGDLGTVKIHPDFLEYAAVATAALAAGSPLFSEPIGWVQNPAAGLVVQLLDPQPGDTVLDLFSAPGGKAMAIADRVGAQGQVFAVDRSEERLKRLVENKVRLGFENIMTITGDVTSLGARVAARVLADVPCSALGTLPKNPEVRWTKKPADIQRLARSQRIWLSAAATHVAPGGILVYATCTMTRQENEDIVNHFLANHSEFVLDSPPSGMDPKYLSPEGYVITNPPYDGLDGVFAARLKRQSES